MAMNIEGCGARSQRLRRHASCFQLCCRAEPLTTGPHHNREEKTRKKTGAMTPETRKNAGVCPAGDVPEKTPDQTHDVAPDEAVPEAVVSRPRASWPAIILAWVAALAA